MRALVPVSALTLALAVLSGCGSSSTQADKPAATTSPSKSPSTSPSESAAATAAPANGAWSEAKSILAAGNGRLGSFRTDVSLGPRGTLTEDGGYTIGPDSGAIRRTTHLVDPATGKSSTQVLSVRRTADNNNFVMQTTGAAAGCWIPVQASDLEHDSSGQSPLPGAVLVLLNTTVAHDPASTGKPVSVSGQAQGLSVLQFLGFNLDEIDTAAAAATATTVPVTVRIAANGYPAGLSVDGKAVSTALAGAGLPKAVADLLPTIKANATLTRLGANPRIVAPGPAQLAAPQGTCKPSS